MISVAQALQKILNSVQNFEIEEVSLLKSLGRILKEDISADRDFPPFNRVAMDGIAIDFKSFVKGQKSFKVERVQAAGKQQTTLKNPKNCIEVMTGAVLPKNTSTVIRYEDLIIKNGIATIIIDTLKNQMNVHQQGKDKQKGALLIRKNTQISAAEIGILATVGKSTVKVAKHPRVIIISTGDELVAVTKNPLTHQIRRSNVFTLASLLENLHIKSETAHSTDNELLLKKKIQTYLQNYDVLLFSGAVSKGKYDFLPKVLSELGVKKQFHKVAQRPGKPFWFGVAIDLNKNADEAEIRNKIVFAFPGNPISTFVNCLVYFYPWFYKSVGLESKQKTAILGEDITFKPNLTYFLQVKLKNKSGHLIAYPIQGNGSGDLASLIHTDAFMQLPKDKTVFKKGLVFPIIDYRSF